MSRSRRHACSCWMCRACRKNQPREKLKEIEQAELDNLEEHHLPGECEDYDLGMDID